MHNSFNGRDTRDQNTGSHSGSSYWRQYQDMDSDFQVQIDELKKCVTTSEKQLTQLSSTAGKISDENFIKFKVKLHYKVR